MLLYITMGGYGMQHKVLLVLETHSPLLVWSFVFRYHKSFNDIIFCSLQALTTYF